MRCTRSASETGIPFKNGDRNPSICNNVVVVVIDASKEWSASSQAAVSWTIDKIMETGDRMILLGVLESRTNQQKFSSFLGSISKSGSDIPNKLRENEVMRIKSEMELNISSSRVICYQKGVHLEVEVKEGPTKLIATQVAMSLRATWVVLNRSLKKEAKFFFDQLPCGLVRMRQKHEGEILRVPQRRVENFRNLSLQGGFLDEHYHTDDFSERLNDSGLFKSDLSRPQYSRPSPDIMYSQNQFHVTKEFIEDRFRPVRNHVDCTREQMDSDIGSDVSTVRTDDNKRMKNVPSDAFADHDHSCFSTVSTISGYSHASSSTSLSPSISAFNALALRPYDGNFRTNGGQFNKQEYNNVSTTTKLQNGDITVGSPSYSKSEMGGSELEFSTKPPSAYAQGNSLPNETSNYTRITSGYSLICSICKQSSPVFSESPKRFTLSELKAATDNFSRESLIAEGGFGFVYKGVLEGRRAIAVKQHKIASTSRVDLEFCSEVELLSSAQHCNLVMLLGYCDENSHRCLVYEYVCNGSLDWHLSFRNLKPLEWWARYKIAMGTARGLRYLHEECRIGCIIHRDLRPTNILLTHEFKPLIGDFGLARFQPNSDGSVHTRLIGAFGYLAPEYAETGQVSWKTDVYSFGVVLLELISGRKAIDHSLHPTEQSLAELARLRLDNGRYYELVDRRLQGLWDERQMRCMVRAASFCIRRDPSTRPRMSQVVRLLEGGEVRDSIESMDSSKTKGTIPSLGDLLPSKEMASQKALASTTKNNPKPKSKPKSSLSTTKSPKIRLSYGDM